MDGRGVPKRRRDRAEEISQLLYHVQVLMLAKGLTHGGRLPTSVSSRSPRDPAPPNRRSAKTARPCCESRCPNKGIAVRNRHPNARTRPGYVIRRDPKELIVCDPRNEVEFFYLRPRDIATYVGSGALDVGITGRDMLVDSGVERRRGRRTRLRSVDVPLRRPGWPVHRHSATSRALRVATSYAGLVGAIPRRRGHRRRVVSLDGAVESAVQLGVADAVADVVETGTTLESRASRSSARSSSSRPRCSSAPRRGLPGLDTLQRRLQGVIVARQYVLMDYDLPVAHRRSVEDHARASSRPPVSPLRDSDWVAVRVMVPSTDMNMVMDELYALGARAILVSPIHAARI